MKKLKPPFIPLSVIALTLLLGLLSLIFISAEIAGIAFIFAIILFIFFLIKYIYHKDWRSLFLLSFIGLSGFIGLYLLVEEYVGWATTQMYQGSDNQSHIEDTKAKIKNGDIIFQTSKSSQSKAIQLATNSKYSHMGIIYINDQQFYVYEAGQTVKLTPLEDWINRGENGHFVIKRLKNADEILTSSVLTKMKQIGEQFQGKPYDLYFEWSNNKIYCSELVWKIFKEAVNVEIGKLDKLSNFNVTDDTVKTKMKERFGENIPWNETVISPGEMFKSNKLITVDRN